MAHPTFGSLPLKSWSHWRRDQCPELSYAWSGTGGPPHIATELFKQVAGIELLHIPYRGDGQALPDVLAGRVPLMMSDYVVAKPASCARCGDQPAPGRNLP